MSNQKVCLDPAKYSAMLKKDLNLSKLLNSIKIKNDELTSKINHINLKIRKRKNRCDEECQANKLKQEYINKQQNLLTAPQQERLAYKNYVVFTEGELAYTEEETQEFQQDADVIADEIMLNFQETAEKIMIAIESYEALLLNYKNVVELYKKYIKENKELIKELKSDSSDIITNDRKTYYEDQGVESLNFYYYYILLTIYAIVVVCFAVFAFGYPSPMNIIVKIVIFVLLIILPFISTKILSFIIETLHTIYNMLPKSSYRNI
jgi:hypothetical protein